MRARSPRDPHGAAWAFGVWLLYSAASSNSGGYCASIRWFVPLLAPGYLTLGVMLREMPEYGRDLAGLSAWSAAMTVAMWRQGPWMPHLVPFWWLYLTGALVTWGVIRWRTGHPVRIAPAPLPKPLAA